MSVMLTGGGIFPKSDFPFTRSHCPEKSGCDPLSRAAADDNNASAASGTAKRTRFMSFLQSRQARLRPNDMKRIKIAGIRMLPAKSYCKSFDHLHIFHYWAGTLAPRSPR